MTEQCIGFSQGFHDAGAAVVSPQGDILYAAHSERYSKIKNDPELSLAMLDQIRRKFEAKSSVHYYERNYLTNLRRLFAGQSLKSMSEFKIKLGYALLPQKYTSWGHHLSHAAVAFQTSPFQHSAVVVIDAIGEFDTVSIWSAWYDLDGRARYKRYWTRRYPHSVGLFYSAMTQYVGLKPMEDEYIFMGMAAYGKKSDHMKNVVKDEFFNSLEDVTLRHNLHLGCEDWPSELNNEDLAANVQAVTEDVLFEIHKRARELTGEDVVCYGGGVALNCAFNAQLPKLWSQIWIPPNPGDCGSALGAAALGYGSKLDWKDAFLGEDIPGELDVKSVINELLSNGIVGVANGRAEWGPRALGNRSLLADPRRPGINDAVNEIKQRQKYRPFAPAILAEHADEWFKLDPACDYDYMQYVVPATRALEYRPVHHVDGTARVQTVSTGNMRKILEAWHDATGCPLLLNTSLNIKGQPMVNNKADAYRFEKIYGVKVIS